MAVTLAKIPLSRLGEPLRVSDPIDYSCRMDVHEGDASRRGTHGFIPPCTGHTYVLHRPRACMCNCHTKRS